MIKTETCGQQVTGKWMGAGAEGVMSAALGEREGTGCNPEVMGAGAGGVMGGAPGEEEGRPSHEPVALRKQLEEELIKNIGAGNQKLVPTAKRSESSGQKERFLIAKLTSTTNTCFKGYIRHGGGVL